MSMPPLGDPHGHHHLPPGTTEDDIAAAAAAAVPSALNRKCGNPTCNDWALRGRGELSFVLVFSRCVCVALGDTTAPSCCRCNTISFVKPVRFASVGILWGYDG